MNANVRFYLVISTLLRRSGKSYNNVMEERILNEEGL